ncbi:hypothetical protein JOF29_003568 [Kribbella aluminosa]|uniref:THAP-type domain-containing protein n=1 Tax=Kribbella aluminosa TaxID=416017 RepID=A0ABS4ULI3_9ACTN|nr:hypothetical protein [Kribbella aluminosa]
MSSAQDSSNQILCRASACDHAFTSSRASSDRSLIPEPGVTLSNLRKSRPQEPNRSAIESMYFCAHGFEKSRR